MHTFYFWFISVQWRWGDLPRELSSTWWLWDLGHFDLVVSRLSGRDPRESHRDLSVSPSGYDTSFLFMCLSPQPIILSYLTSGGLRSGPRKEGKRRESAERKGIPVFRTFSESNNSLLWNGHPLFQSQTGYKAEGPRAVGILLPSARTWKWGEGERGSQGMQFCSPL